MGVLEKQYFQISGLQSVKNLSSIIFMKPSTMTVVLRLNLY